MEEGKSALSGVIQGRNSAFILLEGRARRRFLDPECRQSCGAGAVLIKKDDTPQSTLRFPTKDSDTHAV